MAPRLIALLLLALGLLPVVNWVPGGEEDAEYWSRLLDWGYGIALCATVGVLVWFVTRARESRAPSASSPRVPASTWFDLVAALGATGLYALIAQRTFSGRPLLIDEIVQVLQARWFADGMLSVPTPEPREFYSLLNLVDLGPRSFSQFPAGGPAMLALGSLVGAEWMVGPVAGGVSVFLFARLLRRLEPEASAWWHRLSVLLFAAAPFGAFMFGSHMNHGTTLPWLLLTALALAALTARDDAPLGWSVIVGLGLGMATTIRPLDGAAFALPAGAWLLWRARGGARQVGALLGSGVGLAIPLLLLFWVNMRTTGAPLLFGYDQLWGEGHSLGFHRSPWGVDHTPSRGLELMSLNMTRLSVYLFETPFPALLPAAAALLIARPLAAIDRYLLASAAIVLFAYGAYWHDGFLLGPRFTFMMMPVLVLWTARLPRLVSAQVELPRPVWTGLRAAAVTGVAYALFSIWSVRAPQYRNMMTSMRSPIERLSAEAGVRDALVLVKESWGARLVVRMWAIGVPRGDTEVIYRTADACKIELTLSELERTGVRDMAARDRLAVLRADSALLVNSGRSPDFTELMLPGMAYPPVCEEEIRADQGGFAQLAPFRLAKDGNVYVRWLPGREGEIAARYPGRPVYLLGRASSDVEAPLTWTPLRP